MAKTLATFRIEEDDWKAFKDWAENHGSNASSELIKFVLSCLGRIDREETVKLETYIDSYLSANLDSHLESKIDNNLDSRIDEKLKTALATLRSELHAEIETLQAENQALRQRLEEVSRLPATQPRTPAAP